MANRKEMSVVRARYRNPKPKANSSAVKMTRDVRVSIRAMGMVVTGVAGQECAFRTAGASPACRYYRPSVTISSVSHYFRIVTRDYNPLQFELIIHPHGPVPGFAAQHKLVQFLRRPSNGHFVPSAELEAQWLRGALVRIHRSELRLLIGALQKALVLLAGRGQILPDQNFPMDEKIIVDNAGRCGQEKRLFFRFLIRIPAAALHQEFVIGRNRGLSFARTQFLEFVLTNLPGRSELQFGGLH